MVYLNYTVLDRWLHRLALNYVAIADVSFDVDQATVKADPERVINRRHVFVCGLARSGSTVLMRRFYTTGCYRSLTYRDMPFVLAPNLWRLLSSKSRRVGRRADRAHGDSLPVDYDSPESFDEVFWRVFDGKQYILVDHLAPHEPDEELLSKYVRYVNAILRAQEPRQHRYLSKNNNNILRLGTLRKAFPEALILVPFRDPLQQAHSLLRQHAHFSKLQRQYEFVLSYMTWLGHHEFGLGHRPFRLDGPARHAYEVDTLNYWLQLWCDVYSWIARTKPASVLFVCYEDLCGRADTWERLVDLAGIASPGGSGDVLELRKHSVAGSFDESLADQATTIYTQLVAQSREQLF